MGDVIRRGGIDFIVCGGCGGELDGTGTCPYDCLAGDDIDFDQQLREQQEASAAYRRQHNLPALPERS